jgi:hypothetical protein
MILEKRRQKLSQPSILNAPDYTAAHKSFIVSLINLLYIFIEDVNIRLMSTANYNNDYKNANCSPSFITNFVAALIASSYIFFCLPDMLEIYKDSE